DPTGVSTLEGPSNPSRSSPVPLKRAHGYGEELKGLGGSSPLGDDGSLHGESTPAVKRRKRNKQVYANDSSGSGSEGLDDGEIIEFPPPSRGTQLDGLEIFPRVDIGLHTLNTLKTPKAASSEESESLTSSEEKEKLGQTHETTEGRDGSGSQVHKSVSPAVDQQSSASLPGWNHGVKLGTRTAFGVRPASTFFKTSPAAAKKRVRPRDAVSSFEASNATWNFPLGAPEIVAPANVPEQDDFWFTLLKDWIAQLVQENGETADRLTYKVVRSGWALYFVKRMGFLQGTKKHITATRTTAQNFMASLNKDSIDTMISEARQKHFGEAAINIESPLRPSHDEELRLQERYFPGADDPSLYCLSCSGVGHTMQACPELSCRFCQSKSHSLFGCPTRRRCDKCRQTGHNHQDRDCPEIWRSFKPSELNVKQVKEIPAFCYICGGEKHYGPECSLYTKGSKTRGVATWSTANHGFFVNPESEDVAIAWADVDLGQITRGEFHVPGQLRKSHTYFISSDESEEDLIHEPIKKNQIRGGIRIASNIGTKDGTSHGTGGGHNGWQPPLPPGPPPPLEENGLRKSIRAAPSGTLPTRPQSFARGRPAGRARGGYRGRGRGRGRGK
ncbi:hypothetical protein F4802DRAFT_552836, partial [Xylaria palmicola]